MWRCSFYLLWLGCFSLDNLINIIYSFLLKKKKKKKDGNRLVNKAVEDDDSKKVIRTFYDHTADITDLQFHPTFPLVVSGSKVRIIFLKKKKKIFLLHLF